MTPFKCKNFPSWKLPGCQPFTYLPKGDDISQSLIEAIQDSSISVVVLSQNYATSKWCLNELLQILRCKQQQAQIVVPIFYKIDPSHVHKQRGAYEQAFVEHLEKNVEKVEEWRQALFEIANLAGLDSRNCRDDTELIQNIVKGVINKLNHGYSGSILENIIGINENLDHIESLLEESSTIGIWGMGGIGKTTMAKVVFVKLRSQFDSCCFLENFREESESHRLKYVGDELFRELLKDTSLGGLNRRKVLIVLDDVSNTQQLDYLESEAPPLGPGSKVIMTSRDKNVLEGRVDKIHKAEALGYDNALKLFNLKAFRKVGYKSEYKELFKRAVAYAGGNPLALTILGSFLHAKTAEEWESALRKLENTIHQDIQAVLKLSYDGLDYEEKEIFLLVAFFLKGESRRCVMTTLESRGFQACFGLRILMDKALITIDSGVWMHDLIPSMAFEIVRQECVKNPEGRSRLCNPDEICEALENNQGSDAIQGISLDLSQVGDLQLSADVFRKMPNLMFLKFYSVEVKRSCSVKLPSRLEAFSNSLRYLEWVNFPLESLPLSFCAEKLLEFHMPYNHLKILWNGVKNFGKLREINLAESKQLTELPDFSAAQNLKHVDLCGCKSLGHLHPSILSLPRLSSVMLINCRNIKSLKSENQSKSLAKLIVVGCNGLKEFSFTSDKITYLDLRPTSVEILDFSTGCMEKLQYLVLNCSRLKYLPINDICCMRRLQSLALYDIGGLIDKSKLHSLFDALLSLKAIHLDGAFKLTDLPNNTKHLSRLRCLYVSNCKSLQSLPELPPSIEKLGAYECSSLRTLQLTSHFEPSSLADRKLLGPTLCSSVSYLRNLQRLTLKGCEQLYELSEFMDSFSSLSSLDLSESNAESLPASIKHLSNLEQIFLRNCRTLRSLPELPPFLETVDASGCMSLEIVPTVITSARQLSFLHLKDCSKLENCSSSRDIEWAYFSLKRLVYTKQRGGFVYPGRKVPEWFMFNQGTKASNYVTIELPSTNNDLIGFIFCSVLSHFCSHDSHYSLQCQLYYDSKWCKCLPFPMLIENFDSRHVILWCDPSTLIKLGKTMDDQNTNYKPKLSFEFSVITRDNKLVDGLVEACGVCQIYASDYHTFIQQMESKSSLSTQNKTCHDVDENSFRGILKYVNFSLEQGKYGNFEGSVIPDWFTHKSSTIKDGGLRVSVQLAPDLENLMGFIFCFVMPHFSSKERDQCQSSCTYLIEDRSNDWTKSLPLEGPIGWHYSMIRLNSDNVFQWYDPLLRGCMLRELQRRRKSYDGELEFRFRCGDGLVNSKFQIGECLIKECGVPSICLRVRKLPPTKKIEEAVLQTSPIHLLKLWNPSFSPEILIERNQTQLLRSMSMIWASSKGPCAMMWNPKPAERPRLAKKSAAKFTL
ncbi:TMV resistance protein N-like [Neltuma alba]|uniref:TMV resistance protein N-like n=1 Tax=Neltuma alba TaxID=207710 RepID=UPI0010A359E3|nr:TMV resistance protein N-like [Prosopis alba]